MVSRLLNQAITGRMLSSWTVTSEESWTSDKQWWCRAGANDINETRSPEIIGTNKSFFTCIIFSCIMSESKLGANLTYYEKKVILNKWKNHTFATQHPQRKGLYEGDSRNWALTGRRKSFIKSMWALAGRGHGAFCNSLIIRYHFRYSVETLAFFGRVSTLHFITNWYSMVLNTRVWLRPAGR